MGDPKLWKNVYVFPSSVLLPNKLFCFFTLLTEWCGCRGPSMLFSVLLEHPLLFEMLQFSSLSTKTHRPSKYIIRTQSKCGSIHFFTSRPDIQMMNTLRKPGQPAHTQIPNVWIKTWSTHRDFSEGLSSSHTDTNRANLWHCPNWCNTLFATVFQLHFLTVYFVLFFQLYIVYTGYSMPVL